MHNNAETAKENPVCGMNCKQGCRCLTNVFRSTGVMSGPNVGTRGAPQGSKLYLQGPCQVIRPLSLEWDSFRYSQSGRTAKENPVCSMNCKQGCRCLTNVFRPTGVMSGPNVGTRGAPQGSKLYLQGPCQRYQRVSVAIHNNYRVNWLRPTRHYTELKHLAVCIARCADLKTGSIRLFCRSSRTWRRFNPCAGQRCPILRRRILRLGLIALRPHPSGCRQTETLDIIWRQIYRRLTALSI